MVKKNLFKVIATLLVFTLVFSVGITFNPQTMNIEMNQNVYAEQLYHYFIYSIDNNYSEGGFIFDSNLSGYFLSTGYNLYSSYAVEPHEGFKGTSTAYVSVDLEKHQNETWYTIPDPAILYKYEIGSILPNSEVSIKKYKNTATLIPQRGSLVGEINAVDGAYPDNGISGDRWYVKGDMINNLPIINAKLSTDMKKYIQGDTMQLSLKLTNTQPGDKTNSVTFQIDYDGNTFQPLSGDLNRDIVNGSIPFPSNMKLDLDTENGKSILVSYVDKDNDIALQEGANVFTANFKVKENPTLGTKKFTLRPVTMLDSSGKAYNVNNGGLETVGVEVEITDNAVIEGCVSIYLGDIGTDLNKGILDKLNQDRINDTFKNLKFTLKTNSSDTGIELKGSDVFIPDENGNLAAKRADNKVKGRFRVFTNNTANTILSLSGAGSLKKDIPLPALNLGKVNPVSAPSSATELYLGDIGRVYYFMLQLTPDNKITVADFSALIKIYNDSKTGSDTTQNAINADFTKDGKIDNVDFSLWIATYKKILTAR